MEKTILELKKDFINLGKDMNNDWYYFETKDKLNESVFTYDDSNNKATIFLEVQGTQYEGRNERIEKISKNDKIKFIREPDNKFNNLNISIRNKNDESLGNISADVCETISPLIDKNIISIDDVSVAYVEPLSQRGARCKKSLLTIKLNISFIEKTSESIICILGGDQTRIWAQELSVINCLIPINDAILLFEIYNRANDEYNNDNLGYLGLDNLAEEVIYAREQMNSNKQKDYSYEKIYEANSFIEYMKIIIEKEKNRYGQLQKYLPTFDNEDFYEDFSFKDLLYQYAINEKKYYWVDQCRVNKDDFEFQTGYEFNHWYEIAELYDKDDKLPFDLSDEDIVSIFGFKKFQAFGDLSYGC